jgi:hypothetical protein
VPLLSAWLGCAVILNSPADDLDDDVAARLESSLLQPPTAQPNEGFGRQPREETRLFDRPPVTAGRFHHDFRPIQIRPLGSVRPFASKDTVGAFAENQLQGWRPASETGKTKTQRKEQYEQTDMGIGRHRLGGNRRPCDGQTPNQSAFASRRDHGSICRNSGTERELTSENFVGERERA